MNQHWIEQRVIAHRGLSGRAPENTAAAIRLAYEEGIQWVELDVTITADAHLVMFHDDDLDRCSNLTGSLANFTLTELQSADFGGWFHDRYRGEPLLTLEQALTQVSDLGMKLNLELKVHPELAWESLVEKTVTTLKVFDMPPGQLLVSSFHRDALTRFHDQMPGVKTAILLEQPDDHWLEWAQQCDAISVNCDQKQLTDEFISQVKQQGYLVMAYTVNDYETFHSLRSRGVDVVFSDLASELLRS